jgi:hypothetical protein
VVRLHRRNLWLFAENEKPGRVTEFYSAGCRFESGIATSKTFSFPINGLASC